MIWDHLNNHTKEDCPVLCDNTKYDSRLSKLGKNSFGDREVPSGHFFAMEFAYSDLLWRMCLSKQKCCSIRIWFDTLVCQATHYLKAEMKGGLDTRYQRIWDHNIDLGRNWRTRASSENPRLHHAAAGGCKPEPHGYCFASWWRYLLCLLANGLVTREA